MAKQNTGAPQLGLFRLGHVPRVLKQVFRYRGAKAAHQLPFSEARAECQFKQSGGVVIFSAHVAFSPCKAEQEERPLCNHRLVPGCSYQPEEDNSGFFGGRKQQNTRPKRFRTAK